MQAVHVFARTSSQAEMVQANSALQEAVAVMRRTGRLDADSCPSAYAIEQLVSIADRCHAQSGQEPAVESPRRRKLTHGQYDMRHAVDPNRGLSCGHGHPSPQSRRATEQRYELAAPHSITSSARAMSESGTVRPSALAVLRLITVSYLVGACTGKSTGFSPLS